MSFRIEEKLKVNPAMIGRFYSWITLAKGEVLYERRAIYSTYFDTHNWSMLMDSDEGILPRKKIRIRSYNTKNHLESPSMLETKISSVEGRFKYTSKLESQQIQKYLRDGVVDSDYGLCKPAVDVLYDRSYFKVNGLRLTIDENLHFKSPSSSFWHSDSEVAVEIKAPFETDIDELINEFPFSRRRFSKYARGANIISHNHQLN